MAVSVRFILMLMGKRLFTAQLEASSTGPSVRFRNLSQAMKTDGPEMTRKMPRSRSGNCHQCRANRAYTMFSLLHEFAYVWRGESGVSADGEPSH